MSAVLGAALCSQFPAFFDQYVQSLGGRLDQARLHAARIISAARDQGLTVDSYVRRFAENVDPAVQAQAEIMSAALADETRLGAAFNILTHAPMGVRPLVLLRHLEADIAAATAERFAPAAPLGLEGLIYTVIGAALALAAFQGGRALARRARRDPGQAESRGANHAG